MNKRLLSFWLVLLVLGVAIRFTVDGFPMSKIWKGSDFSSFFSFRNSTIEESKKDNEPAKNYIKYSNLKEQLWIDSVFASMNDDQKIGQFFMVALYPEHGEVHFRHVESLITNNNVGGFILFQGQPVLEAQLINRFQSVAKVPLIVSIDGEHGLAMRVSSTMAFPKQLTLGAIQNNQLIFKMGAEIARQCKRLGVSLNFAPVVDINSNPDNPIIGHRSFGEIRENVAEKSLAYMKGMQSNQLIACAKHFPGHGDTQGDSHHVLPKISYDGERLHNIEFYPFQQLINDSVQSIIVGHLQVPFYDMKPATLSQNVITNILKNEMGFKGLVITDALNMRGVRSGQHVTSGEIDLQAFLAGNDILLYSENPLEGIRKIKGAIATGVVQQADVDARVRKILKAKYWAGLHQINTIETTNLYQDLNSIEAHAIKKELFENAITVVKDDNKQLPLIPSQTTKFLSLAIDARAGNAFQNTLSKYAPFQHFNSVSKTDEALFNEVLRTVDSSHTVVISLHDLSTRPSARFGVTYSIQDFIKKLEKKTRVILCVFGNPYSLKYFPDASTVVCGYEDEDEAQTALAEILFGHLAAKGKLPVSIENLYKVGDGIVTNSFGFTQVSPESVGMNSSTLNSVDPIISNAIDQRVFPGCQLFVARKGKVVYQKNYGNQTYQAGSLPIKDNTIFDLASVTKVSATLQSIMYLYDKKKINIDDKAIRYLPELKGTNKENILIKDLLYHQAGLVAYIPFWERTRIPLGWKTDYYSTKQSAEYPLTVADGMYAKAAIRDSVWKWVIKSPLINKKERDGSYSFVYSDLGLIMLQHIVEKITGESLDNFTTKTFYEPLGMTTTGFNPIKRFQKSDIAPTENDNAFRERQVQGTVQDQTAAMLGGVSGHAGLFSNAQDLAILMQMNLNKGSMNGKSFFQEQSIGYFTKTKSNRSHRALGWDKLPSDKESNYISSKASEESYGHSGYTGTLVWVDPVKELVFVFLSNRVYPSAGNNKINSLKIRAKIMDIIYKSME